MDDYETLSHISAGLLKDGMNLQSWYKMPYQRKPPFNLLQQIYLDGIATSKQSNEHCNYVLDLRSSLLDIFEMS